MRRSSISRAMTRVSSRIGVRCAGIGWVDAVDHRLEVAGDDREGRPQLVADVGEQRPSLLLVRFEARGHRVEPAGELLDRGQIRARAANPHAVVAVLDAPGRRQHRVEVAGRPGGARRERRDDADATSAVITTGIGSRFDRTDPTAGEDRRDDDEEQEREDAAEALPEPPRPAPAIAHALGAPPHHPAHLGIAARPRPVAAVVAAPLPWRPRRRTSDLSRVAPGGRAGRRLAWVARFVARRWSLTMRPTGRRRTGTRRRRPSARTAVRADPARACGAGS